jgi:hypothetical protein
MGVFSPFIAYLALDALVGFSFLCQPIMLRWLVLFCSSTVLASDLGTGLVGILLALNFGAVVRSVGELFGVGSVGLRFLITRSRDGSVTSAFGGPSIAYLALHAFVRFS